MKHEPEDLPRTRTPVRVAVRAACVALLLQLLGLLVWPQPLVALYAPCIGLLTSMFPEDWSVLGNVLFGLLLMTMAAVVYAASAGFAVAGVVCLMRWNRG